MKKDIYKYNSENNNFILTDNQLKEMIKRKADLLSGKTTSRPWNGIKKKYETR